MLLFGLIFLHNVYFAISVVSQDHDKRIYLLPAAQSPWKSWQEFYFDDRSHLLEPEEHGWLVDHVYLETVQCGLDKRNKYCAYETVRLNDGSCVNLKKFEDLSTVSVDPYLGFWIQPKAGEGNKGLVREECPVSIGKALIQPCTPPTTRPLNEPSVNLLDQSSFPFGPPRQRRPSRPSNDPNQLPPYSRGNYKPTRTASEPPSLPHFNSPASSRSSSLESHSSFGSTNSPPGSTNSPPGSTHLPPGSTNSPPGSTHLPPGSTNSPPGSTNSQSGSITHSILPKQDPQHEELLEAIRKLTKLIVYLINLLSPLRKVSPSHSSIGEHVKTGSETAKE